MSEEKDSSVIPEGVYCYVADIEKNENKDEDDHTYYIKRCPYWSYIEDEGVDICHCSFLEKGCVPNGTSDEDYEKLEKKYGSLEKVLEKYPLDLLWDQVKECGENKNYQDEEND